MIFNRAKDLALLFTLCECYILNICPSTSAPVPGTTTPGLGWCTTSLSRGPSTTLPRTRSATGWSRSIHGSIKFLVLRKLRSMQPPSIRGSALSSRRPRTSRLRISGAAWSRIPHSSRPSFSAISLKGSRRSKDR